jgi:xanthine dehydrogenase accessory factor
VSDLFPALVEAIRTETPAALAEIVEGPEERVGAKLLLIPGANPEVIGSLGDPDLDRVVTRDVRGELAAGLTGTRHYGLHGEARERELSIFVESFAPPPRMVIFGAVDFTAALARVAKILGYRVTVCDARPVFATRARFPMADDVVVSWPDRYLADVGATLGPRDAVCVLTHDSKFDVPAIVAALETGVGYLGAMGSRRTTEARSQRLRDAGVSEEGIARVMAPIGLDIGARTPEETAVSICAEVIAARTGREAPSLRDKSGPIHRDVAGFPQRPADGTPLPGSDDPHPAAGNAVPAADSPVPLADSPVPLADSPVPLADSAAPAAAASGRDAL